MLNRFWLRRLCHCWFNREWDPRLVLERFRNLSLPQMAVPRLARFTILNHSVLEALQLSDVWGWSPKAFPRLTGLFRMDSAAAFSPALHYPSSADILLKFAFLEGASLSHASCRSELRSLYIPESCHCYFMTPCIRHRLYSSRGLRVCMFYVARVYEGLLS